jgi:cystathionine beta-lyase
LPKARLIEPEGTYLIWIDFSAYNLSNEVLDDLIINKGRVWLDSGHIFGPGGQGFQRINIACPWQVLSDGLSRLDKAFATI